MKKKFTHILIILLAMLFLSGRFLTLRTVSAEESLPVITKQPGDVSGYEGEIVKFSVEASGKGLSYQWQWSDDGSNWSDSSIRKAAGNLRVKAANDGRKYRCVITDRYGNHVISDILTVTMRKAVEILRQPENVSGYDGELVRISVGASGYGLSSQWQWSDDGSAWADSSIRKASGSLRVRQANNGRLYRCVITDAQGNTVISDPLTVTLRQAIIIQRQPADVSADEGEIVRISVEASGEGLSYQWQWSDDGSTWSDSSIRKASGTLKVRLANDGRKYRCVVTDQYGTSVISRNMTVTMNWVLSPKIEELIAFGKQYLGTPYVYGGESLTKGIDCSSFTQQCYLHIGISIYRTSYRQVEQGTAVPLTRSSWKPGDLIFYNVDGKIGHVAIYIGGGKILHSAQSVGGVCISEYNYNGNVPVNVRRMIND